VLGEHDAPQPFTEWINTQAHWQDRVADFANDVSGDPDWPWPRRYGGRETWQAIEDYLRNARASDDALDAAAEAWHRWLRQLGGPRCDNCGLVATYVHWPYPKNDQCILSCDSGRCENRSYFISLADWYGDPDRLSEHIGGKTWGQNALALFKARLAEYGTSHPRGL
jgi:YozE SAM-like fold